MTPHVNTPPTEPCLAPEDYSVEDHLVTEDDVPVDGLFSEKQQRLLCEVLFTSWAGPTGDGRFVAMANVGLFYEYSQPPLVPDMLLSLGVELPADLHPKKHRSYFVWRYRKAPEVVVEVVSNREGGEDTLKLKTYAHIGVRYYIIYDPERHLSSQPLRLFQLSGTYVPLTESTWLEEVGLGLCLWEGIYEGSADRWLRWCDRSGRLIPTGAEQSEQNHQRADQERQRADQERQRADQERQRAEQECQRAEQAEQRAEQERQLRREPGQEIA